MQSARSVWRQSQRVRPLERGNTVAICTERVEAKKCKAGRTRRPLVLQSARSVWRQRACVSVSSGGGGRLQSARSVWRQSTATHPPTRCPAGCNLHGACGGKVMVKAFLDGDEVLQSARSVWRQRQLISAKFRHLLRCNLHGACGGKAEAGSGIAGAGGCNLHGACGRPCIIPRKKTEKIYADLLHFYSSWCIIHLVRQTDTK